MQTPTRPSPRRALAVLSLTAALLGTFLVLSTPAQSAPTWAPAASAAVHPGVQTYTAGGQCTANFIFTSGTDVLIGQAAHCASTGGQTETDGCSSGSLPLGTPVEVTGASQPGTLVYSSWLTMQANGETDPDTCAYNDFALVRLDPADHDLVNPSIPHWGGPEGLNTAGTAAGDVVHSYGNSSLRQGITLLSPKTGLSIGTAGGGWTHNVYTFTPGIPGDSGSAFLDAAGNALGTLSTLQLAPVPASNGVGDLSRELAYLNANGPFDAELALGTEAFNGSQLPLGLGGGLGLG
jgi:hypothetical protein